MSDLITNIPQQGTILVIPPTSTVIMPPTAAMLPSGGFQSNALNTNFNARLNTQSNTNFQNPKNKNYKWLIILGVAAGLIYLLNKK